MALDIESSTKHLIFTQLSEIYSTYLQKVEQDCIRYFLSSEQANDILPMWRAKLRLLITDRLFISDIEPLLDTCAKELKAFEREFSTDPEARILLQGFGQGVEVEIEQTVDKALETETQLRKEIVKDNPTPDTYQDWPLSIPDFCSAQQFSAILPQEMSPALSDIQYSPNYIRMFVGCDPLQYGSKPVHQLGFYKINNQLHAVIITAKEVITIQRDHQQIAIVNLSLPIKPSFITTEDTDAYNLLLSKAFFINGDIGQAIKIAPQWVKNYRESLYVLATRYLKNVHYYNTELLNAMASEKSFGKFIISQEVAKRAATPIQAELYAFIPDIQSEYELEMSQVRTEEHKQRNVFNEQEQYSRAILMQNTLIAEAEKYWDMIIREEAQEYAALSALLVNSEHSVRQAIISEHASALILFNRFKTELSLKQVQMSSGVLQKNELLLRSSLAFEQAKILNFIEQLSVLDQSVLTTVDELSHQENVAFKALLQKNKVNIDNLNNKIKFSKIINIALVISCTMLSILLLIHYFVLPVTAIPLVITLAITSFIIVAAVLSKFVLKLMTNTCYTLDSKLYDTPTVLPVSPIPQAIDIPRLGANIGYLPNKPAARHNLSDRQIPTTFRTCRIR